MALQHGKVLGLAMEDRAILAAEVSVSRQGVTLLRTAEFAIPEDAPLEQPQLLGRALGEFLRKEEFSARAAVIGVPARWLLATERIFPSAESAALANMVSLDAERRFATDMEHLVLDHAEGLVTDQGLRILVAAITRDKIEQMQALSQAAGLKLKSVASTALAFASGSAANDPSRLILLVRPNHVEAVTESQGRFTSVKHLPVASVADDGEQALSEALLRLAALMPESEADAPPSRVVVWNGAGLDVDLLKTLGEPFGQEAELIGGLAELGLNGTQADSERCAGAAALALAGARSEGCPIDFLHSRLSAPRKPRNGRTLTWGVAIAATVVLAVFAYILDWHHTERELRSLQGRLDEMAPAIAVAEEMVERTTLARGWTDQRPRFLEPARELALLFPPEAKIWVTSLAMREDMRVVITGKSGDKRNVLQLMDRIRRSAAFDGVKLVYMREANSDGREVAFSMTFDFSNRE